MKNNKLYALFLLSVFVLPLWVSSVVSIGNPPPLLTTSYPPSINSIGTISSEEEQIDSFDVFPSNRWSITNVGFTASLSNSIFSMTDTGDDSIDSYTMQRDLRDLQGTIITRFRFDGHSNLDPYEDSFSFILGDSNSDNYFSLDIKGAQSSGVAVASLIQYQDTGSTNRIAKTLSGDERLESDIWYTLRVDYDILVSKVRMRLYLENNQKVFDYDQSDFGTAYRLGLFSQEVLTYTIKSVCYSAEGTMELLVDYIKAPYKEKEWTQLVTPSDADWITDSHLQSYVQDDIDEYASYSLVIPFFDHCSGTIFLKMDDIGNEADGDNTDIYFQLYGVDGDDGGLHEVYEIKIHYGYVAPTRYLTVSLTTEDEFSPFFTDSDTGTVDDNIRLDFDIGTYEDRSKVRVNTRHYIGEEDDEPVDVVGQADLSASVTDPSNEYILKIFYYADFTGNQFYTGRLDNFNFISKDIFQDTVGGIAEGIWKFIGDIFIIIGKFLAGIFKFVGDIIVAAVQALEPLLTAISGAITAMQTALNTAINAVTTAVNSVITELQGLAAAIATAVWDGIGTALDFITNAVEGIWAAMILILDDVIAGLLLLAESLAELILDTIDFLLVLLIDLIDAAFDLLFAIWNSVPFLVDISEIADLLLDSFFDVITGTPELITDIMSWVLFFGSFVLIIWWFWALFLSFAEVNFNPFEGMGGFFEKCFYDLLPFSLLGFEIYVPMGLFFIPLTFFLVLTESAFYIW